MCTKCKNNPRVNYTNSHSTWCRNCNNEYKRNWKEDNPDKIYKYPRNTRSIVYAYFNALGKAVYVGRGTVGRALGHKYGSMWWSKNLLLVTMTCSNEWEAMEYEGKWGGRYLPLMNKDGYRHQ